MLLEPGQVHVRSLSRDDVPRAAALLAETFARDEVMGYVIQGRHDRVNRLRSLFSALLHLTLPDGAVDLALDDAGELLGVAQWEASPAPSRTFAQVKRLPQLVAAVGIHRVPATLRALRRFRPYRLGFPHWWLEHIAVGENARGLGVGSHLLAHRLRAIDAAGLPAYLEATTEASARLYARHGFGGLGVIELAPSVRVFPMLRPLTPPERVAGPTAS